LAFSIVAILAGVAPVATAGRAAGAVGGQVRVTMLPAEITLSAGDESIVDLVISNNTASRVKITAFYLRLPAQVAAERVPLPAMIRPIPSNSFDRVTFTLRALPGIEDGEVDVLLEVKRSSPLNGITEQLLTSSLTVNAGAAIQRPTVAFLSFPEELNDGQSARAALRITNQTPFSLEQIQVAPVDSEDLTLRRSAHVALPFVACPVSKRHGGPMVGCLATLAPGGTAVLYLDVQASSRVQTGMQRVSVVVTSRTGTPGVPITSTVIATAPVQVTVFGLDALSPFGLGVLFVLPGLLTVLTFLLLARYVYPRSKELPDTVQFKDPRTLLFVVPPATVIYLLVWAVWGVNLSREAGTQDVALLFGLGVGLGFVTWGVVAMSYYARSGRKQFGVDDSPEKVLKRLEARHARLTLPGVIVGNLSYRYLAAAPGGKMVVCSPAKYAFIGDDKASRRRFRDALEANDVSAVYREVRGKKVRIRWQLPTGVTLLDHASAQFQAASALMTEEDLPDGA
jgi:hypothetical protein